MSESNPLSEKDKKNNRLPPDIETESFGNVEELEVARMVVEDYDCGRESMAQWREDRVYDIKQYNNERPSDIEQIPKKTWQSDRNLGLCQSTCDSYHATLLKTCWNLDTLHFIADEPNDVNHKDNLIEFSKWMVSEKEADVFPQVYDYIHNKITTGTGCFKVYWKVWYEWVDRRIPKYDKNGEFKGYDVKTENVRFERGVMENIHDIDDLVMPHEGNDINEKPFVIHVLHKTADCLLDEGKRKIYKHIDEEFISQIKDYCYNDIVSRLGEEKAQDLGFYGAESVTAKDARNVKIDLLEWYGMYEKDGKKEKYRITVEPNTKKVLAMKPLRKVTRTGKLPFVGGALIRRPGIWHGKSLPYLIKDVVNAFNLMWNQKADFQYVSNIPFGFYKPSEDFDAQRYELEPGVMFPTETPKEVYFPNLTRSLSWADSDFQLLLGQLEKMTGAASFFMDNESKVSATATRDAIINQKSETRFGLWVDTSIKEIVEAISLLLSMYQDWAPSDLGERVIGEDGKQLFDNFSIETIRGGYKARMIPDIISGSKTLERQIAMWALQTLGQTPWFMPQINPRGNWMLVRDVAKKFGVENIEDMMPDMPKGMVTREDDVLKKWGMLKQGDVPEIKPTDDAIKITMGISALREDSIHEIDEEFRPLVDLYLFKLSVRAAQQVQEVAKQQQAEQLAMQMIGANEMQRSGNGQVLSPNAPGGVGGMEGTNPVGGVQGAQEMGGQQGATPAGTAEQLPQG